MTRPIKQTLSHSWLYVLRMLDKSVWALLHKKVDHATMCEKNEITDMTPLNQGTKYIEYVFEVVSYSEHIHFCYVRLWLRVHSNLPRIDKVTITSPEAVLLGEWDGTKTKKGSFGNFLRGINGASMQYLDELIHTQPPLSANRKLCIRMSNINPETVIKQLNEDTFVVQAMEIRSNLPIAELIMHNTNGLYWAETIKLYNRVFSVELTSETHHHSENLWSNDYKEIS